MIIRTRPCVAATVLLFSLGSLPLAFQGAKSAAAAKELTQALDAAKLDAIAAADPSDPSTFVAALYIQGSQLLVVSAKYAAPTLLTAKIKTKEFRDIYMDLSAASIAGSKVFIIDQNCDGLLSKPEDNGAPDTWEAGPQQVTFDGEWRKAKLTEDAYGKMFSDAEDRYTKILSLLTAQAKQPRL
jgi:hypothetical protein